MRYERVLLVFPAFVSDLGSSRPSPSIAYIAQSLDDNNIKYDIMDMKLGYKQRDLERKILEFKPDLLGFTVFTLHYKTVYDMISNVKSQFPYIKIIVGGPHASIQKGEVLKECSAIDYACVHEGEELIVDICRDTEINSIKGLVYKENGGIKFNGIRPFIEDLNKYGYPKLKKFELNKYASEILIISSRGCPYSCIYCSVHLVMGKTIRLRSVNNVVDEIEYFYKKGKRIFNFVDDNFTFYKDRVFKVCDEIEKRKLDKLILRATNGVRADRLDYNLLKRMKEVGFRSIGIGVEAGNNKVLKTLKKGETIEEIEMAIDNACKLGYEIILFFVFGSPGETVQDIEDSISLALKYPVFKAVFFSLVPFPGTELYDWVEEKNAWTEGSANLLDKSDKVLKLGVAPSFLTKELPLETRYALNKKLLNVMRQVERRYIVKALEGKIGPLSYVIAYLVSTKIVRRLYFNNNKARKLVEKTRYLFLK
jgi:anaerobic magnesium-protoporphyrin IX monomethyl ester cyclase